MNVWGRYGFLHALLGEHSGTARNESYHYFLHIRNRLLHRKYLLNVYSRLFSSQWWHLVKSGKIYIVGGMGRCGTTLLTRSIAQAPRYMVENFFISLQDLTDLNTSGGFILKTHDFPPTKKLLEKVKIVWMFGNPMNTVISLNEAVIENPRIISDHYRNSHSPYFERHSEIYNKDTLGLERHFDSWYRPQAFEFLSVRYETLYDSAVRDAIGEFIGWELMLPEKQKRKADWCSHPRKSELEETYGLLNAKIDMADDVKWWKPIRG